jgi:sugar (pentulose or hexulose) kinase
LSPDDGEDLIIGIDISTTAVKAIAWNLRGQSIATGRSPLDILNPQPNFYEQNANQWWEATCLALHQVFTAVDPGQVKAVSIAHQRESFVPLDANHQILRPAILWLDQRAHSILTDLANHLNPQSYHQRTGKPLSANLTPPKIAWLRENEIDVYAKTRYWLDTHAFLTHRFTGKVATSTGSADPTGLFDLSSGVWDEKTLNYLQIETNSLPAVYPPGTILGWITPKAAVVTGLAEGTPLVAGIGDGQAAAVGMGTLAPGQMSLSLGTSVIGGSFSPTYKTSTAFRTMSGASGSYVLETVILSGVQILNWLVKNILGKDDPQPTLTSLQTAAASISPGSEGLILVPYWNGAMNPYWDPSASGILLGLKSHHQSAHIFRAALEGIAFELRLHLEGVEEALGYPIQTLVVSGGGSQSSLWLQILADICGKKVQQKEVSEASSLGAAMLAATGAAFFPDVISASTAMTPTVTACYYPDPETGSYYSSIYLSVYRPLYPAVRSSMQALDKL